MEFSEFNAALEKHFSECAKDSKCMFRVDVDGDVLWENYLNAFPPGMNQIFRQRREFDCGCCRGFVRQFGNVVFVTSDYDLVTIWDFQIKHDGYQQVANTLSLLIKSALISEAWVKPDKAVGTRSNLEMLDTGNIVTWNHFHVTVPAHLRYTAAEPGAHQSNIRASRDVLKRSLEEISPFAVSDVLDMITEGNVDRGEQWIEALKRFLAMQAQYNQLPARKADNFLWLAAVLEPQSLTRIKNSSMGTLLVDLSEGVDPNVALAKYTELVSPGKYKRPKAVYTQSMVDRATAKITELGLQDSIRRRFARISDISVRDVLYADRDARPSMDGGLGGMMDVLKSKISEDIRRFENIQAIGVEEFVLKVLPDTNQLELLLENRHVPNLVSLVAPENPGAPSLMQWENNFGWAYNGNATGSMRQRVAEAGGRVDGALRFTHSWNHPEAGRNASLMDLHVFFPGSTHTDGKHNGYPHSRRVGWNKREDEASGASQDVDYVAAAPVGYVPIENISFPDIRRMPEGVYTFKIHNWSFRHPTDSGFRAEIEFAGQTFFYNHPEPLAHKEWITLARVTLKDGQFSITHVHPHTTSDTDAWGLSTNRFHKVSLVCYSPNYWETSVGQRHYFFMIPGCVNPEQPNGFFNEFLPNSLMPHRQVLAALGNIMKVPQSTDQLSGLGFSATQRNSVIAKVNNRPVKIVF